MEPTILTRAVTATLIPAGHATELPIGTVVQVVQALGGNVTVRTDRGLYRIPKEEASAIKDYTLPPEADAAAATFSEAAVWEALKSCFDPEIPINIVDLGLIYDMHVEEMAEGQRRVEVKMTLTAQGCGMGPVIAEDARQKIAALPTVAEAKVYVVWDPIWTPQMISPEGRKRLGLE